MPDTPHMDLDVLIIGGGIMGLWFANDLQAKGYHYALIERHELGGEQTCHSHVYIHQGYIYNTHEISLASRLRSVTERWRAFLSERPHLLRSEVSYFGFRDENDFVEKRVLWEDPSLSLPFQVVPESAWPAALAPCARGSSGVGILASTPERCLDGSLLCKELQTPAVRERCFRISSVYQVRVGNNSIETVVRTAGGQAFCVRSAFVVFAAGSGNLPLIADMFPERLFGPDRCNERAEGFCPQQIRKAHMLMIRGSKRDLPPLNGVFRSFGGLFIVSRETADDNVWLVSDHRSPVIKSNEDWIRYDERWWWPEMRENLKVLSPAVMERAGRLLWGCYEAPKAEGTAHGKLPEEERILQVSRNTWAVWPTKLTLAPQASQLLLSRMGLSGVKPAGGSGTGGTPPRPSNTERPSVAPEKWVRTPMFGWNEFLRNMGDESGAAYGS